MTRAQRMKKLAGLVRCSVVAVEYSWQPATDTKWAEVIRTNNYRKHMNQLKALRGKR